MIKISPKNWFSVTPGYHITIDLRRSKIQPLHVGHNKQQDDITSEHHKQIDQLIAQRGTQSTQTNREYVDKKQVTRLT